MGKCIAEEIHVLSEAVDSDTVVFDDERVTCTRASVVELPASASNATSVPPAAALRQWLDGALAAGRP